MLHLRGLKTATADWLITVAFLVRRTAAVITATKPTLLPSRRRTFLEITHSRRKHPVPGDNHFSSAFNVHSCKIPKVQQLLLILYLVFYHHSKEYFHILTKNNNILTAYVSSSAKVKCFLHLSSCYIYLRPSELKNIQNVQWKLNGV